VTAVKVKGGTLETRCAWLDDTMRYIVLNANIRLIEVRSEDDVVTVFLEFPEVRLSEN
jgi:hypothetical protein